jgi:hypothetical protein
MASVSHPSQQTDRRPCCAFLELAAQHQIQTRVAAAAAAVGAVGREAHQSPVAAETLVVAEAW